MRWLERWLDLPLRVKCLILISCPAAATVAMAGASYLAGEDTKAASQQLNASLQIGNTIQRLRTSEIETSAHVRAYVITSDEAFEGKARGALAAFDTAWQSLADLTANDHLQRQRLAEIAEIERLRVEQVFGSTARFRSGDLAWQQVAPSLRKAEAERLSLEQILRTMEEDNNASIAAYLALVDRLRRRHDVIAALCLAAGLIGGILMTLLFAHGIAGRIGRLQGNVAQILNGARLDPLPGRDEIGTLNLHLAEIGRLLDHRRFALETALDGIAEVDSLGRYRWWNKAYGEIAGLSEIYRPATIQATLTTAERSKFQETLKIMRQAGRAEIATQLQSAGAPPAEVEMTLLDAPGVPQGGFYVFLRNPGSGFLGREEVIQVKAAAAASVRAKTDFLAKISHDIRTPLNAILGAADLLSQTALTFDQSGYVHMFQRNCRRLVALINDFLDFSRIEAGAIQLDDAPFRMREILDDALSTFREDALRKGIALEVEVDPETPEWMMGDSLRIQQVLVNLLSNALKFTPAGRVMVQVKALDGADSRDRRLLCEVADSGPGIAPGDQDKIFGKFVQLANQTAGQRGTGLGLAICRDLVDLMGGEMGVTSHAGGGSVFYFTLPLVTAQSGLPALAEPSFGTPPSELPAFGGRSLRILIAEDTEDNRLLLEHYLRPERVELRFAFTGQEAVDIIQRGEKFDLILMDIDMPILDGYGAARAICAWEARCGGASTPIVALSADAMSDAVNASLEAGCVAHVAKPIDRATLLRTIQQYARTRNSSSRGPTDSLSPPPSPVSKQVQALVPQYLANKQKQIEEARLSLASRDFGPIRRFGHNLKGTGTGYGFPAIEQMGRELERAATEADIDRIAGQLDALHRFVNDPGSSLTETMS